MWPENIISIQIHDHSRCIYHAPTVVLKALELEFKPIKISTNKLCNCGILRHWHKASYEFNDAVLYGDIGFGDIVYHYKKAMNFLTIIRPPILLVNGCVIDGAHRLLCSFLNNEKSIDAISLSWDNFEYILSEIQPIYKELKNMPNCDGYVLAINTFTKEVGMQPSDNIPSGWTTEIPDAKLINYVNYISGKWVPDRETLIPELSYYLRLQCRTLSKEPISYLGHSFYFGKYELTSMLTELAVSDANGNVVVPDSGEYLIEMSVSELKELLKMYNNRKKSLCVKMTSVIDKAKGMGDDDLIQYCASIFNNPFGD